MKPRVASAMGTRSNTFKPLNQDLEPRQTNVISQPKKSPVVVPKLRMTAYSGFNLLELPETARKSLMLTTGQKFKEVRQSPDYDSKFDHTLKDISTALYPYVRETINASTITDRRQQAERRTFRNTY